MFGRHIPEKQLAVICRALSTMLQSGIAIGKVFDMAGKKTGDPRARRALAEISVAIRQGRDVSSAMRETTDFPDLMCDMADVAENTGALPEVLHSLAEHYENNVRLRRNFYSSLTYPMLQLLMAILVIAAMIYLVGEFGKSKGGPPFDPLGFGLLGAEGARTWLMMTFGTLFAILTVRLILMRSLTGRKILDPLLMRIPVLGGCMRSFAIARFSWAFSLTQQSGMAIDKSLEASFRATSNGAFVAASPHVCAAIMSGETLHTALVESKLFPVEYLEMIDVGETAGTVPETLERLSPQFEEQARRSLAALTAALGWGIWILVAGFIIFLIFRIALTYIGMINDAAKGI